MEFFSNKIPGYFSETSFKFYEFLFSKIENNSAFVEIGSFKGRSSSFFATLIANGNKEIRFYCIDTWEGSEEHQKGGSAQDSDVVNGTLFETFLRNVEPVKEYILPVRMTSLEGSKIFKDNSLEIVFIDASHDYENVKADILAWLPKIKEGGIISGHDSFYPPIQQAIKDTLGECKFYGDCWYKEI